MGSVPRGPQSQDELRCLVEAFLLTQPIPQDLQTTLAWMITDYCDVVCGAGMLAVPNTYYDAMDGAHWDFVVSAVAGACCHDLTLSYRGHKLGLWYRQNGRQPIVIANPEVLERQRCYRVRLPQRHEADILDRPGAKSALSSPVSKVLLGA